MPSDPLFQSGHLPWTVDATLACLGPSALDALPWTTAFDEMAAVEAGAHVNSDEDRQVGHYWLRAPETAPTIDIASAVANAETAVRALAEGVASGRRLSPGGQKFSHLLHLGVGGSALGPQLLVGALGANGLIVAFVDNTDPDGIERCLAAHDDFLGTTLVSVASKSGGTAETRTALALVRARFEAKGHRFAAHAIALTTEGSALDRVAATEGWLARFPMWDFVGGRFSVTSCVGLLPAALAGVDVSALLAGAAEMDAWTRAPDWRSNPAALLAGVWHVAGNGRGDRSLAVLPYSDRLLLLSRYLQQLVMESVGKRLDRAGNEVHQGLAVYGNKGSTDQHAFVQQLRDGRNDALTLFVQVLGDGVGPGVVVGPGRATAGDWLAGFLLGTRRALKAGGRPTVTITVPGVDARVLGGLIALFERTVGLYAGLVGINAYHQPGVEAGKVAASEVLGLLDTLTSRLARPVGEAALAKELGSDLVETRYLLWRLRETGRAKTDGVRWWAT